MRNLSRLLLPLVLLLFGGVPALAQSGGWSVSETKGVVVVIDAKGQRAAKAGTALAPGATVRTEARASAVLVRGREFVTLRQNAQLRIPLPAQQKERGIIQIIQDYGSALFNIGKQPNPHFGVETPYLAAVVKGTTFVITVSDEGASLQVTEGAVETATLDGGARDLILPGSVAMIAAGDPLRMVVEGEGRRVIDSPARPAGGPPAPAPGAAGVQPAAASGQAQGQSEGQGRGQARIEQAVFSTPSDLGEMSRGFVSGEVTALAAVVAADNTARGNAPAFGNSAGRSDDGNGNGNGNGGGSGNGNGGGDGSEGDPGNGNGNGSGNGGSDGNGGGNGNGNGDGGGGGNGSGDGNGGSNGSGSGSGNGNGDGGGNGNGNGNGNGGGGGGNGDGGGKGNGNGNGNGNGGGNGNGNGGGDGNGNGDDGDGDDGDRGNGNGNNGNGNGNGGGNGTGNEGGGNGNGNGNGNGGGGNGGGGNGRQSFNLGLDARLGADVNRR